MCQSGFSDHTYKNFGIGNSNKYPIATPYKSILPIKTLQKTPFHFWSEHLHTQIPEPILDTQMDFYFHLDQPHPICVLPIGLKSLSQYGTSESDPLCHLVYPLGVWLRHPLLLILRPRSTHKDSPPFYPWKEYIRWCLCLNTYLPSWTHRLLKHLLDIASREHNEKCQRFVNIKILLNKRIHYFPMWGVSYLKTSPPTSHYPQLLWCGNLGYKWMYQNDPISLTCSLQPFTYWPFSTH